MLVYGMPPRAEGKVVAGKMPHVVWIKRSSMHNGINDPKIRLARVLGRMH